MGSSGHTAQYRVGIMHRWQSVQLVKLKPPPVTRRSCSSPASYAPCVRFNWPNSLPHCLHFPPVAIFMPHGLQRVGWPQGTQEYSIAFFLQARHDSGAAASDSNDDLQGCWAAAAAVLSSMWSVCVVCQEENGEQQQGCDLIRKAVCAAADSVQLDFKLMGTFL